MSGRQRPAILYYVLLLGIGFFAGRQSSAIDRLVTPVPEDDASYFRLPHEHMPPVIVGNVSATEIAEQSSGITPIRLHERVEIAENAELFDDIFRPLVADILSKDTDIASVIKSCPQADVKPYLDVMQNLHSNPQYYESSDTTNDTAYYNCPVVFLFYYESGTTNLLNRWINFHSNIATKRCIKIIAPRRYRDGTDVHHLANLGYELIGPEWPVKQDKVININLDALMKEEAYGENTLVSVNDLDHLLVWFDAKDRGRPYRYSTYSDMVRLYVYELLSTSGCTNQMVLERYAIPCTCVLEDNAKYIDLGQGGTIYSQYGKNNLFRPTSNFYLRNGRPLGIPPGEW